MIRTGFEPARISFTAVWMQPRNHLSTLPKFFVLDVYIYDKDVIWTREDCSTAA